MNRSYSHLTIEERAVIMTELKRRDSIRKIANILGCSPSTISREIKQSPDPSSYHVQAEKWPHLSVQVNPIYKWKPA